MRQSIPSSYERLRDELSLLWDVRLASEEFSQDEPSADFRRIDDKISSFWFARSPERYRPYLRAYRRTVTVSGHGPDRWSIPLNQVPSLFISAVLLANSSVLHGQELHANAEELPTFVLGIIGGAAVVAYYWLRKVIGRKKSRRR